MAEHKFVEREDVYLIFSILFGFMAFLPINALIKLKWDNAELAILFTMLVALSLALLIVWFTGEGEYKIVGKKYKLESEKLKSEEKQVEEKWVEIPDKEEK